ncbi:MAG: 30S ribosomal protein S1 [Lachnospiraceae bacterium]|nr:30S ribosomal protein S1 [Lachnospiraceae bacterium]
MQESFEELLNSNNFKTIRNGEVVDGTVIGVKAEVIYLSIGYKADGYVTRAEYSSDPTLDLRTVVSVGDEMKVKVLKVNDGDGQVALSYKKLAADRGSKKLEEAFNNKEILKAKVTAISKGGLSVTVDDTRIFIPASLVSDVYEKDLTKYQDEEVEFIISEFDVKKKRIIGDCKQIIVAKKSLLKQQLFDRIAVGDVVKGKVKSITDFGAFIDLGGVDGLLHVTEMSWSRIDKPSKLFKIGDEVEAFIKEITGEKIGLSCKFDDANPWKDAETKYPVGAVVTGKVARMVDYGAFVEIVPGVDGFLHVSQIAKERIEKPSSKLKIGQEVTAKITELNVETKRLSLSIKALDETPAEETVADAEENQAE